MAIAYQQSTSVDTSGTSAALQFVTKNCTKGSTFILGLRVGGSDVPTISDDTNGTWPVSDVSLSDPFSNFLYIYHFSNSQATNKATITVSVSPGTDTLRFGIYEFTGLVLSNALDKTASATGGPSTTPASGATAITSISNELFFACAQNSSAGDLYSAGTNVAWILKETPPSNGTGKYAGEYFIANSTQVANGQFTLGTLDTWTVCLATYKGLSSSVMRKTLTPNGTRVGSRQILGNYGNN